MRPFGQDFKFAQMLGMQMVERGDGFCRMVIDIEGERHFNPQKVAHGGVAAAIGAAIVGQAVGAIAGRTSGESALASVKFCSL